MVRELRYLLPESIVYLDSSSETVANWQKIELIAVGRLINCMLTLHILSFVQSLCSFSQMRRDREFPRQIFAEAECIEEERCSHKYICDATVSLSNYRFD